MQRCEKGQAQCFLQSWPLDITDLNKPLSPTSQAPWNRSSAYVLSYAQLFATPWTVAHQAPLSIGYFPGKNTGVGCQFLLQGIFSIQSSNPSPLCVSCIGRWILSHCPTQNSIGAKGGQAAGDEQLTGDGFREKTESQRKPPGLSWNDSSVPSCLSE